MSVAFLFPGQCGKIQGLFNDLYNEHKSFKSVFENANDILGYDLWKMIQNSPENEFNLTKYRQASRLVSGVATFNLLIENGFSFPEWMVGHSMGEYTTLVASESISFENSLKIIKFRSELMQKSVPVGIGAMGAVVGLTDEHVERLCKEESQDQIVSINVYNGPGQPSVAGHKEAVHRVMARAEMEGAKKVVLLPLSVPPHTLLLKSASEEFETFLKDFTFAKPKSKIIHNADNKIHESNEEIRDALVKQFYLPVHFDLAIQTLEANGVRIAYEVGGREALVKLVGWISKKIEVFNVGNLEELNSAITQHQLQH